jgi:23S rRNA pseudouridine2605 synthase
MDNQEGVIRLNKYIAHCGVCNRKKAVELVKSGEIMVNGKVETNPFLEMKESDEVAYKGKILVIEEKKVYILMNKPRDTPYNNIEGLKKPSIETLVKKSTVIKVFPAHPLEESTSGLVVLTNDQEVISKLAEPDRRIKSVFECQLDKEIQEDVLQSLRSEYKEKNPLITGIKIIPDREIPTLGIEILRGTDTSMKNVLLEKGFDVVKADRTFFMGLTKKDLKRGWSRPLTEKEVIFLKYFN